MTKSLLIVTVALGLAIAANDGFTGNRNEAYIKGQAISMVKDADKMKGFYENDCETNIGIRNKYFKRARGHRRNATERAAAKCYPSYKFYLAVSRAQETLQDMYDHPPRHCNGHSSHRAKTYFKRLKQQANRMKKYIKGSCR